MKVKLTIPESLKDITLGQYQDFQNVIEQNKEEDNDDFVLKKMVQIFCNTPLAVVDRMRQVDFLQITNRLKAILEEETELENVIELSGYKLGFIPKLDDIKAGEFADLSEYVKDIKTMHKAMAVLYRPIKGSVDKNGRYLIVDYEGDNRYAMAMKQLPMSVVQSALVFFWNLKIELLEATLRYLKEEEEEKLTNGLEKSGDGINHFTQLLEEITLKLRMLKTKDYTGFYYS